ncbi:hypothetical protein ACO0OL_002717 [Hanseniaspora opuntiae]|jgi:hypothetical protein|uniref:RTR1-type domain-containing protein n=1 Tax=Hanseniaspora opuntiae TaxID=211096 RepID=A0A1E5RDA0_9ASCO|nr:hypothetical protein AWRI3578_g2634 [Hanseniaspora opuntiae]
MNKYISNDIDDIIKSNKSYKTLLLDLILHFSDYESNTKDLNFISRIIDDSFIQDVIVERNCNENKCGYLLCREKISTRRNSTLLKTIDPFDNAKLNWTNILNENQNDFLYYNKKFCSKTCYIKNNYMVLQIKDVDELLINREYSSMINSLQEIAEKNENKVELWDDKLNEYDIIKRLNDIALEDREEANNTMNTTPDVSMNDEDDIIIKENKDVTLFDHDNT